jgi:glycine oxidase
VAQPDFVIAGAGIVGLSVALELQGRGAHVVVLEAGDALRQTSFAAAGMLAVEDRANPPRLAPLSRLSAELYAGYLDRIADLSGERVPFQTTATLEALEPGEPAEPLHAGRELVPQLAIDHPPFRLLAERSVDPRHLGVALVAAVRATSQTAHPIDLREQTDLMRVRTSDSSVKIVTSGEPLETPILIDCMGTWSPAPVTPRKGQMLAVNLPEGFDLTTVVRTASVYIVPRTDGPNAGRAIIGATIEDVGFDLSVHPRDILDLNTRAVKLLPGLERAEFVESWAGLRPSTEDGLPILGATPSQPRYVLATGHFRNGILLAPATARVIADLVAGIPAAVDLGPYTPARFTRNRTLQPITERA